MSSSTTGHSAHSPDRPERSRNAKAQARHRAKRKAYIEQLETTVTKLQTALGFSPEDIANLPAPMARIQDLEEEVDHLRRENLELRRLLGEDSGPSSSSIDMGRRNYPDGHRVERDLKRRKMVRNTNSAYMSPALTESSTNSNDGLVTRPPPLTIPQPHHYSQISHHQSAHNSGQSSSLYNANGNPGYHIPNTPSASSSTSSPPFSPVQLQHSHSPVQHRHNNTSHHVSQYSSAHSNHQAYAPIKVEEDHRYHHHSPQNTSSSHPGHYSLPPFSQTLVTSPEIEAWHPYASDRLHHH